MLASGICRSDLSLTDGKWPAPLPIVLGHEGAGVIEAVGRGRRPRRASASTSCSTFAPACGRCRFCLDGPRQPLHRRGRAAWTPACCATARPACSLAGRAGAPPGPRLVVRDACGRPRPTRRSPIPASLDPAHACLLGCGVTDRRASVDAAGERAPRRFGRGLRLRRRRALGGAGGAARLRLAGDRRRPARGQARAGAGAGRDARARPGRGRRRAGRSGRSCPAASTTRSRRSAPRGRRAGLRRQRATAARRC